jgi:hypothetical protein
MPFFSETLNELNKKYSTFDSKFYAIHQASKHWRHYSPPKEFVLCVYHQSLKFINMQVKMM